MFIAHVRVLRAPLFERLTAAHHGTTEWLLSRMDPNVILKGAHGLAPTPAVVTHMVALAWSKLFGDLALDAVTYVHRFLSLG